MLYHKKNKKQKVQDKYFIYPRGKHIGQESNSSWGLTSGDAHHADGQVQRAALRHRGPCCCVADSSRREAAVISGLRLWRHRVGGNLSACCTFSRGVSPFEVRHSSQQKEKAVQEKQAAAVKTILETLIMWYLSDTTRTLFYKMICKVCISPSFRGFKQVICLATINIISQFAFLGSVIHKM